MLFENVPKALKSYQVESCLQAGHYWTFNSNGLGNLGSLLYGLAAGCLAELTNGLVNSIDGAWDYEEYLQKAFSFSV